MTSACHGNESLQPSCSHHEAHLGPASLRQTSLKSATAGLWRLLWKASRLIGSIIGQGWAAPCPLPVEPTRRAPGAGTGRAWAFQKLHFLPLLPVQPADKLKSRQHVRVGSGELHSNNPPGRALDISRQSSCAASRFVSTVLSGGLKRRRRSGPAIGQTPFFALPGGKSVSCHLSACIRPVDQASVKTLRLDKSFLM